MENNQREKELLSAKTSVGTFSIETVSASTSMTINNYDELPSWRKNSEARGFCGKSLTSMYALLLTLVALVIEVSPTWDSPPMWVAYNVFSIWMYGTAVLFFVYLYLFVIYPTFINAIVGWLKNTFSIRPSKNSETVHNEESAGTLYLRLGVLLFGLSGSSIWITEIILSFYDNKRNAFYVIKYILAFLFTIIQMIFIVFYSKTTIKRSDVIARFGLMHCVAVNLWTWFSLCLSKVLIKKMKKAQKYNSTSSYSSTLAPPIFSSPVSEEEENNSKNDVYIYEVVGKQLRVLLRMGNEANLLLTFLVEFFLIGAAICFIIWKTESKLGTRREEVKSKWKFDCRIFQKSCMMHFKSTCIGLFLGVIVLLGAIATMIVHGTYTTKHNKEAADMAVGYAEIIMFTIGIFACAFAMFRMRKLQYRLHAHNELIDEVLLVVGLAGEMVFSSVGLDTYLGETITYGTKSVIVYTAFILRMVEVTIQTLFILLASRLRSLSQNNIDNLPGKQVVTFLLVCNITLFFYHSYEAMESSFGFPEKMPAVYDGILSICSPIVIFYRFHSSACLAEILKHAYTSEKPHHGNSMFTRVEKHH